MPDAADSARAQARKSANQPCAGADGAGGPGGPAGECHGGLECLRTGPDLRCRAALSQGWDQPCTNAW
jgi:hypothetical protein